VPLYLITEHPTVEALAVALGQQAGVPGLMLRLGADTGRVPLYLAASGHGDLLRFQGLERALAGGCDLYMMQPPLDGGIKTISELATMYADRIQLQSRPGGYLAGFSVAGIAALETARILQHRGWPVRGLILVDTTYPTSWLGGVAAWRWTAWMVRHLHIQELSMNGRRLGAMFNDPGLVSQVMALRGYRPIAFDGPTLLLRSSGLATWDRWLFRPWRRLSAGRIAERQIPGMHGSIFDAANVGELAAALSEQIESR
jgi:syringomycin synthetase protein SyrE